jgi:hypothetical protein
MHNKMYLPDKKQKLTIPDLNGIVLDQCSYSPVHQRWG